MSTKNWFKISLNYKNVNLKTLLKNAVKLSNKLRQFKTRKNKEEYQKSIVL